jgi:hypothetical protein
MTEAQVIAPPSRARLPKLPVLIRPGVGGPLQDAVEHFTDVDALAGRAAELAAGAPLSFCAGAAALPGFDTFPTVTVYAGGRWLATVYLPGVTADTAREALAAALGVTPEQEAA